jgi:transposase-like protein
MSGRRNGRNPIMTDDDSKNHSSKPASGEVPQRASRRTFSREYKLRIVREAEQAASNRELGALLRREGLYSSLLASWRREFSPDGEVSLEPVRRGPKPRFTGDQKAVQKLERENERLRKKLEITEALLDLQKKTLAMLDDLERKDGAE